jgi:hypothetical protein
VNKLVHQPTFPYTSFSNCGYDLTTTSFCSFSGVIEGFDFRVSSDKLGESTGHSRL